MSDDTDDRSQRGGGDEQADERMLADLRSLGRRLDPVPDAARLAARSQLAYLRLDAELAELVHDSSEQAIEAAGVRSDTGTARRLTFEAGSTLIEVEVVPAAGGLRFVGQCVPTTEVTVTARCRPEPAPGVATEPVEIEAVTDDLGRFTLEVPAGHVSLRCVWAHAGLAVETAWVRV